MWSLITYVQAAHVILKLRSQRPLSNKARIDIGLMAHLVGFGTYELLAGKFLAMIASSASDSGFDLEI